MNDMQELVNIAGMTADAIKNGKLVWVVRCKDCKHYNHGKKWCQHMMSANGGDWFCADGERREQE